MSKKSRMKKKKLRAKVVKLPCPYCLKDNIQGGAFLEIKSSKYTAYKLPIGTRDNQVVVDKSGSPTGFVQRAYYSLNCSNCKLDEKIGFNETDLQEAITPILEMLASMGVDLSDLKEEEESPVTTGKSLVRLKPSSEVRDLFLIRRDRNDADNE